MTDQLRAQNASLRRQLALSRRKRGDAANDEDKEEKPKSWWEVATQFLALPAILILMVMQFTTAANNVAVIGGGDLQKEKTKAEIAKLKVDTLQGLDKLQQDASGRQNREAVSASVDDLRRKIDALADASSRSRAHRPVLEIFILVWAISSLVSLFTEIISHTWGTVMGALFASANTLLYRSGRGSQASRLASLLKGALPFVALVISPMGNLIGWSVRLALFTALVMPTFDYVVGEPGKLAEITKPLLHGDVGAFLADARRVIFPDATG